MAYKSQHTSNEREERGNYIISSRYPNHYFTKPNQQGMKRWEFRLYPAYDLEGAALPQSFHADGDPVNGIGEAFHAYECSMFLGNKMLSFVSETTDFPEKNSPAYMFVKRLLKFFEEEGKRRVDPEWLKWRDNFKLSVPGVCMLTQGLLLHNHEGPVADKMGNPRGPCLIYLPRSATMDMEPKLSTKLHPNKPLSAENSLIGDVTSPDKGKTIVITTTPSQSFGNRPGKNTELYVINAGREFPLDPEYCRRSYVPWAQLIQLHDAKWQIAKLVETFDAKSVDYALGKDPDYGRLLPDGVKGAHWDHPSEGAPVSMYQAPQQAPAGQMQYFPPQQPMMQPAYQQPMMQQPAYAPQQPMAQQPAYQQPMMQQPMMQPAYQQPAYQQPMMQQPAYAPQQPMAQPAFGSAALQPNVVVDPDGEVTVMDDAPQAPANPVANELLRSIIEERERQMKAQGLK